MFLLHSLEEISQWNLSKKALEEIPWRNPLKRSLEEIPWRNPIKKSREEIPRKNPSKKSLKKSNKKSLKEIPQRNLSKKSIEKIYRRNPSNKSLEELTKTLCLIVVGLALRPPSFIALSTTFIGKLSSSLLIVKVNKNMYGREIHQTFFCIVKDFLDFESLLPWEFMAWDKPLSLIYDEHNFGTKHQEGGLSAQCSER